MPNKRVMRTVDQDYAEFKDFVDIAPNLVDFHAVYLTKLYMGEHLVIKLKKDSENEEFPYIIEAIPIIDQPMMVMDGGDIVNNFKWIYNREPTHDEFMVMREYMAGIYGNRDFSDLNEEITDAIHELIEQSRLPQNQ